MSAASHALVRGENSARSRGVNIVASEPGLVALVGVTALVDAVASVIRHVHLESGLDVAIFDQAVWHYSRFQAPFSSIKGRDLLGDHFHPIVALLAPLYWIWADPRMLLIAQAVLVAASIVPVFLFAESRVGRAGAYMLAGAYAAFWGIQAGTLFEFHEVAFAPLLISLAILLSDRRQWPWFWLVIALILCIKEDLSIFVFFFGLYLLSLRQIRHGIVLILVGAAWYELATRVFIPHFSGGIGYSYWTYGQLGNNPPDALWAILRAPWRLITIGLSPSQKAHTIAALFAPFLFTSLFSRLLILTVPLLAERFLSTNADFWSTHFHYSLAIAPVLAMAGAAGLSNLARLLPRPRRRKLMVGVAGAMLIASLAITMIAVSNNALQSMTQVGFYRAPSYEDAGYRALAHVPRPAPLATTDSLLPHASERNQIQLLDSLTAGQDQYIIVNVANISCCGDTGNSSYAALGNVVDQELKQRTPVYYQSGWLVARLPPRGQLPGNGVLIPMSTAGANRVDRLIASWRAALASAGTGLETCLHARLAHSPSNPGCFTAALKNLTTPQQRLVTAIKTGLRTPTEGCTQLGQDSILAAHSVHTDLASIAAAGQAGTVEAPAAAFTAFQSHELNQDRIGLLNRFAILCTPR